MRHSIGHAVADFGECDCVWHSEAGQAAPLSAGQVEAVRSVLVDLTASTAGRPPALPPTVASLVASAMQEPSIDTEEAGTTLFAEFLSAVVALEAENVWLPSETIDRRGRRPGQASIRGSLVVGDDGVRYGASTDTLSWAEIAMTMFDAGVRVSEHPRVGLHGTRVDWLEPGRDRIEPQPHWANRTSTYFWPVDGLDFVHGRYNDAWAEATEFGEKGPAWNRVLVRVETSTAIDGTPTVYVTRVPPFAPTFTDANYAGARRVRGGQEIVGRIHLDELPEAELGRPAHRLWFAGEATKAEPRTAEFVKRLSGGGWAPTSDVQLFRLIDGSLAYRTEEGADTGTTQHFVVAVTVELPSEDTFRHADLIPTDPDGMPLGVLQLDGGYVERFKRSRSTLKPGMTAEDAVAELLQRNRITTKKD